MIGYIYKITNKVNGKVYIGQTITTVQRRWNQHKRNARYSKDKPQYDHHFARAIIKYGADNFIVETLETINAENNEIQIKLDTLERSYIKKFDSMNNGYNSTLGGNSGTSGRTNELSALSKPIVQYDYDGNIIKEWPCAAEAARVLGIAEDQIRKCANGYRPICRNPECIWRWKNDSEKPIIAYNVPRIIQLDLGGNVVKIWYSYKVLLSELGERYAKNVSRACLGNRLTYNGFIWKYENRS